MYDAYKSDEHKQARIGSPGYPEYLTLVSHKGLVKNEQKKSLEYQ